MKAIIGRFTTIGGTRSKEDVDYSDPLSGEQDDFADDDVFAKGRSTIGRKKAGRSRGQGWCFLFVGCCWRAVELLGVSAKRRAQH